MGKGKKGWGREMKAERGVNREREVEDEGRTRRGEGVGRSSRRRRQEGS